MNARKGAKLLVFAKAPVAGAVKTRLFPALTPQAAAELQRELIEHTLTTATRAPALAAVELWCAPSTDEPFFAACRARFGVTLAQQRGADLGLRMHFALAQALQDAQAAVLIGTDCPAITRATLAAAFAALDSGSDAVFAPAEDGGYVLVGLRRPDPRLFTDMQWSNGAVWPTTRERLIHTGTRFCELPTLWDVDRPADLPRYRALATADN